MKKLLLIMLCLWMTQVTNAQIFKETKRTSDKGAPIAYTDTMAIFSWTKDSVTFTYKGFKYNAAIKKNVIDFYYKTFKIAKNTPEEIILSSKNEIHFFTPYVLKKNSIISINVLPTQLVTSIDAGLLQGNWVSYKRANRNGPSNSIDAKQMARVASFDTVSPLKGQIKVYKQAPAALYTIIGVDGAYLLAKDAKQKDIKLPVFELDARNFVFEDPNGILYFCRKVK